MNKQVNLRLSNELLGKAQKYAKKHGFGNVQELIRESLREKVYEEISSEELSLIKRLLRATQDKNLWGTEKELFNALQ